MIDNAVLHHIMKKKMEIFFNENSEILGKMEF